MLVPSTGESFDPEGQEQDSKEELDHSAESDRVVLEEKGTAHRIRLTGANKRMFHLLKRAKVQLIKIDQQKQLKSSLVMTWRRTLLVLQCLTSAVEKLRMRPNYCW